MSKVRKGLLNKALYGVTVEHLNRVAIHHEEGFLNMRYNLIRIWLKIHFVFCLGAILFGFNIFMNGSELGMSSLTRMLIVVVCIFIAVSYGWTEDRYEKNHPQLPDPRKLRDAICPMTTGKHNYSNLIGCQFCGHQCGHHNATITYSDRAGGSSVSMCEDEWTCPDCGFTAGG